MCWHFGFSLWFLLVSSRQPQGNKFYDLEKTERLQPRDIAVIVLTVVSKLLSVLASVWRTFSQLNLSGHKASLTSQRWVGG